MSTARQARIVAALVGLIAAVVGLSHDVSFIQLYGRLVLYAAVVMSLTTSLQLLALRHARLLQPGEDVRFNRARASFLFLIPLLVASRVPTTELTTLALSVACAGFWLWQRALESTLVDLEADRRSEEAAWAKERREAERRERYGHRSHGPDPVLSHCIDPHVAAARQRAVHKARRVLERVTAISSITTTIAFAALSLSGITDATALITKHWHQPPASTKTGGAGAGQSKGASRSAQSPSAGGPAKSGASSHSGSGTDAAATESPCPPIPDSATTPASKVRELEDLYDKRATPGTKDGSLGRAAAGCPTAVKQRSTPDGVLYWVRGQDGTATKSVAIVSPVYKNTIVIGAAVEPTEELIYEGEDLHGPEMFPRYYAGGGVYYLLYEGSGGTPAILAGESVGLSTVPLVLMRPGAVVAWISTIRERKRWLWPSVPTEVEDHDLYALTVAGSSRRLETISYDRATAEATREKVAVPYSAVEESLTTDEIAVWAARVPK